MIVTNHVASTITSLEAIMKRDQERLARAQATLALVAAKRAEWAVQLAN